MALDGSLDPVHEGMAGTRVAWEELPPSVRGAIEGHLGGRVATAETQAWGFSPALASRLALEDGTRAFVKAIAPDERSGAPGGQDLYRSEARVARALPHRAASPRLLAELEADGWVVLVFEDVVGAHPTMPWHRAELTRVLDAIGRLAEALTPSPVDVAAAAVPGHANPWELLAAAPGGLDRLPGVDPWVRDNLGRLAGLTGTPGAYEGTTLLHSDLRADNVLMTEDRVVFVDWPHASVGAPWIDLLYFLPSVALQGGPEPDELFWRHPSARSADPESVAVVLAGLAGYLLQRGSLAPDPGLPTVRAFQRAQGLHAVRWLRSVLR